ncbi:hypothetical protein ACTTAF_11180 [Rhodobacter capsulatus]|uniref:hypothetical protein n=1 Tax=Rhodobacter capsulatus TaxID=1061 RepID=UPI004038F45A
MASAASAGGQAEQPCEVKSSTTTGEGAGAAAGAISAFVCGFVPVCPIARSSARFSVSTSEAPGSDPGAGAESSAWTRRPSPACAGGKGAGPEPPRKAPP